jgi:hypothetical protein
MVIIEGGSVSYNYNPKTGGLTCVPSQSVADPDDIIRLGTDGNYYCKACSKLIENMYEIPAHTWCSVNN